MAISRTIPGTDDEVLSLFFNNGDLTALKSAVSRLGFKDEESLLRYILAVMSKSATRTLTVIDQDGKSVAFNPSEAVRFIQ
jgi:hypothetical protein